jgi:hypothetical protein
MGLLYLTNGHLGIGTVRNKKLSVGMDMKIKVNTGDLLTRGQPEQTFQRPSIKTAHLRIEF